MYVEGEQFCLHNNVTRFFPWLRENKKNKKLFNDIIL